MRMSVLFTVLFISAFLLGCDERKGEASSPQPAAAPTPAPLSTTKPVTLPITYKNTTGKVVYATFDGVSHACFPGPNTFKVQVPPGQSSVSIPMATEDKSTEGTLKVSFYTGPSMTMEYIPK